MPVAQWLPLDPVVAAAAGIATYYGASRLPRERRMPWFLFGIAQLGTAAWGTLVLSGVIPSTPGSLGVAFPALYIVALAGFVPIWRSLGRIDPDAWLDASIVSVAIGILAWEFLLDTPATPNQQVSALFAGIADLVLLLVVMRLFVQQVGPASYLALISAVCLTLGMYATEYLAPATPDWFARVSQATWVMAYAAWGAIPLHPATRLLGVRKGTDPERSRRSAGFLVLLAVVLATPTVSFLRALQAGTPAGTVVLIGGTAALAILMFFRTIRVLRTLERDVERRRRAEVAAVEHREQLAAYQALVPVGIFATDGQFRLLYANEGLHRLLGISSNEHVDSLDTWFHLVQPDDRFRVVEVSERAIRERIEWSAEARVQTGTQGERWVEIRAKPFGRVTQGPGWIGSVTDITPQVTGRLAAEEREGLVHALIDQSPTGICVFAADGRILESNPAMERIGALVTAAGEPETAGMMAAQGVFALACIKEEAQRAFAGEAVQVGPVSIGPDERGSTSPEGSAGEPRVHLRITLYPVKGPGGDIARVIGFFVDATAEVEAAAASRRMEDDLRETQKLEALGVLAGGIAHDFNNLLVGILGNINFARGELAPESPATLDLARAEAAAERAAELARQMLAYSGRGTFITSTVRLDAIVLEMAELLERSIAKSAKLEFEFEGLTWVNADVTQLRQVVLNLIINASDALDGRGVIRISTGKGSMVASDPHLVAGTEAPAGVCARLAVADTGRGMHPETIARAFEPFFSTKEAGRGLGLATTLGIIRGLHGALRVQSLPGIGTTFEVFLPLADAPAEDAAADRVAPAESAELGASALASVAPAAVSRAVSTPGAAGPAPAAAGPASGALAFASAAPAFASTTSASAATFVSAAPASAPAVPAAPVERRTAPAPARILVVDDEDLVRTLARRVLERAGYRVSEIPDGGAALEAFTELPDICDAALLDITLPTIDGITLLARFRALRPDLPIVLSSGWSRDEVPDHVLRSPLTRFLHKPYRAAELVSEIQLVMAAAQAATPVDPTGRGLSNWAEIRPRTEARE